MQVIETPRLKLLPFTLQLMQETLVSPASLSSLLTITIPSSWPGPGLAEALPFFIAGAQKDPATWNGLVILKSTQTLIGDIGFMRGPDLAGRAEIGYSILPEYRNQGYATEMATTLVQWALAQPSITSVIARTLKENHPSMKVITRAGLQKIGEDEENLLWETPKISVISKK